MGMDPLAIRVARRFVSFRFEPKETKVHRVDRLAQGIRENTGLSKGMSEAIADAVIRGREVERLAMQKGWPIEDGLIVGPSGTMPLPGTGRNVLGRYLSAAGKALRVYDFDDTLVSSKGGVVIIRPSGEKLRIGSDTFAYFKPQPGDKIDFGAFNDVIRPRKIKKNLDTLRQGVQDGARTVILTARPKGSASAVKKFLEAEGIQGVEVVALASSDPYDKARWIDQEVQSGGYDDVEFRDDSRANVAAVQEYGQKHTSIRFHAINVPYPKEQDYEESASELTF